MTVTILYQTYQQLNRESSEISQDLNGMNCFELDVAKESLLLFDVLYYFAQHLTLSSMISEQFQYFVQYQGRLVHLPSPSSIIPVGNDGIVVLRLFPGISPLVSKNQLAIFQAQGKQMLFPSPSSSSQTLNNEIRQKMKSPLSSTQPVTSSTNAYGVGDFSEAAEVKK